MKENKEGIREMVLRSLPDALRDMAVGESYYAPTEYSIYTVKSECSRLKSEGYEFTTRQVNGRRLITRIR